MRVFLSPPAEAFPGSVQIMREDSSLENHCGLIVRVTNTAGGFTFSIILLTDKQTNAAETNTLEELTLYLFP